MTTNKFGLSRDIPPDIKYAIRREAGFGCVICGIAIGEYEHIDPEFVEAKEHDPKKMTLLCGQCHNKVTRGYISKDTVWRSKINPWCKQKGHCHESFDVGSLKFSIWIGGAKVENIEKVISIDEECILSLKPPEEEGVPFRLSGVFYDNQNIKVLEIVDNEWFASSDVFDLVCFSGKIGIRQGQEFVLKLLCFPATAIVIEVNDMIYKGLHFKSNMAGFEVKGPRGGKVDVSGRLLTATKPNCSLFSFSSEKSGVTLGGGIQIAPLNEKIPTMPIRAMKFKVNGKCPCGSQNKYKKCCHPKYDYEL